MSEVGGTTTAAETPPALPTGRVVVEPPPPASDAEGWGGQLLTVLPVLGSLGAIAFLVTSDGVDRGRAMIAGGLFAATTLAFVVMSVVRMRRQRVSRVGGSRTDYLDYLGQVRAVVREAATQQRRAALWAQPPPQALPILAEQGARIWQGSGEHELPVRYGTGPVALSLELVPPTRGAGDRPDPVAEQAMRRLIDVHRSQPELPLTLDLATTGRMEIRGEPTSARALARSLVCSAAAQHSPAKVRIAVLCAPATLADWDWVKWLPHAHSRHEHDAIGPRRLVDTSADALLAMLGPTEAPATDAGHLLLLVDDPDRALGPVPQLGDATTVVTLAGPHSLVSGTGVATLQVADDGSLRVDGLPDAPQTAAVADRCDRVTAEALARRLTPQADSGAGQADTSRGHALDLLGVADVHRLEPATTWRPRSPRERLRVPIGVDDDGNPVHLDLKESAQLGMGPHGLVIGATGSGKSEFLRTLVLGLAVTHSPEQLNLVLVDFKGGATFAGMAELPHVSAVITNLADELPLVDRMHDALTGEMVRRQELLRRAGNLASIHDYERARANDPDLPVLPSLLIVVDEFSELLSAQPDFVDLFVAIGRLGRSLGLHLLLASQRLEEGRLRGLESHLSYRVGLRTFSAAESRAVLGVPDAYELPATPGLGYLKPDPATLVRFQAAYVSGPAAVAARSDDRAAATPGIMPFTIAHVRPWQSADPAPADDPGQGPETAASVLDVAVARLAGHGPPAHQVWLPPLSTPDTLDVLMDDLADTPGLGLVSPRWRAAGPLVVPLGTVDRPREQRRDPLTLDLSGAGGHVAIVGAPRSGKSTLLRTLVTALALTTSPAESQFYILDFGGGAFAPLTGLPHVSGVSTRSEPEAVRRTLAELGSLVDARERLFRDHGLESMADYRRARADGLVDDGYGDLWCVIDGWATLRAEFDDLELELQQLAARGLTFGLHVLLAATRWADLRAGMRDLMGSRLELRLGDPLDSELDRRTAALVPPDRPGRGLTVDRLHFLAALPRIDGDPRATTLSGGLADLVAQSRRHWSGPAGPKLRLLPAHVSLEEVLALPEAEPGLAIGLDEQRLAPVLLDPGAEPHLVVYGDGRSGKTAVLRTLVREIMRTRSAQQAQLVVVDYRRGLLGEVPDAYSLNYLTNAQEATPALRDLAGYLEQRLPGPEVTPEQLRDRSWWQGAEVFVVIDDYDLVATGQGSVAQVLQPLMAQAQDVGLHLVVARRSGGAGRAMYEPVLQSLRDLAVPGLLLSGSPEEGPLVGHQRPERSSAGRGLLVTREAGTRRIQVAWTEPAV